MRILYVTQWFDPEPNIIKGPAFVRALEAAGHEVTVLTGLPNYPTGKLYPGYRFRLFQEEQIGGVSVKRVPLWPNHSTSSLGRMLNFGSFFLSVLIYLLLRGRRYQLIYAYHPPITVGLAAALAGMLRRRPLILEIQDLWPDTVVVSGMTGTGRLWGALSALCDFTYRRSTNIIVQAQGMARRLIERGVEASKVAVVRNWADDDALTLPPADRGAVGFGELFTLVYGGNLGRMQALDIVLRAMAILQQTRVAAELVLIGDGIDRPALMALADELKLRNVRFVDRMPQKDVVAWFASADALLLNIASDPLFEVTIPSKTQFYLAAGKPIVAGIDGEAAELLVRSGAAVVAPPGDVAAMADAIRTMVAAGAERRAEMAQAGRAYYDANLSFDRGISETLAVIATAAS